MYYLYKISTTTYLSFLFFLSLSLNGITQDFITNIQHFSVEDGLSHRTVQTAIQDDNGYIWLATDNGLNRFDGKKFKYFNSKNTFFPQEKIDHIEKDAMGNLWLKFANQKVLIFDPELEKYFTIHEKIGIQADEDIWLLKSAPNRIIWLIDKIGNLYKTDGTALEIIKTAYPKWWDQHRAPTITPWETILYSNKQEQLIELDLRGRKLLTQDRLPLTDVIFYEDSLLLNFHWVPNKWKKYLRNYNHIKRKNQKTEPANFTRKGHPFTLRNDYPTYYFGIAKDNQNNIWYYKEDEIYVFNEEREFLYDLSNIEGDFVETIKLNDIYFDQFNQAWLCTRLNGFLVVNLKENQFDQYLQDTTNISTRGITEIDDNTLMIGTYKGLKFIDKSTKELIPKLASKFDTVRSIIFGLSEDTEGKIWAGSHNFSIKSIDKKNLEFATFHSSFNVSAQPYSFVLADKKDSSFVWIGSTLGLKYLKKGESKIKSFEKYNEFDHLSNQSVKPVFQNNKGVWLSSNDGLYWMNAKEGIIKKIDILPHNKIVHIHEDNDGIYWMATTGGGLLKWNDKIDEITQYTTQNGLSHDVIYAVYEDDFNNLWLPSNNGLMRMDKTTEEVFNYLPEDGITHLEFNTSSHYQAKDGQLFFGGLNGVTAFYPRDVLQKAKYDSPVVLNNLNIQNSNTGELKNYKFDFQESKKICLEPHQKYFNLEFALLDYRNPTGIQYAWKIEGLDKEWTYQKENFIRVNSLPFGNFLLKIKGQGSGGHWSANELSIPISVLKPFYLKPWFIITCILGVISLIIAYINHRTSKLKRERTELESLVKKRTMELERMNQAKDRFLAIIAHDLRSPVATLSGLTQKIKFLIAKNRIEEVQKLGDTVEGAVNSVHKLLDNLLNWALVKRGQFPYNPELLNASDIIENVVSIYQNVADVKEIQINSNISEDTVLYADKDALNTILRNLLDNALKFTPPKGSICLSAQIENGQTIIGVKDSGIGIPKSQIPNLFLLKGKKGEQGTCGEKGSGLGLVLCNELVKMNKGSLQVESKSKIGTSFFVNLPAKN